MAIDWLYKIPHYDIILLLKFLGQLKFLVYDFNGQAKSAIVEDHRVSDLLLREPGENWPSSP